MYRTLLLISGSLAFTIFLISLHALHSTGESHGTWIQSLFNLFQSTPSSNPIVSTSSTQPTAPLSPARLKSNQRPSSNSENSIFIKFQHDDETKSKNNKVGVSNLRRSEELQSKSEPNSEKNLESPSTVIKLSSPHPAVPTEEEEDEFPNATKNMSCQPVSFPPKCKMYFYVKFWNKRFFPNDCYVSPLQPKDVSKLPYDQQKYVVFMPDQG
jgi:hypothetical protein